MFPFGHERYKQVIQGLMNGIAGRVKVEQEWAAFEEDQIPTHIQPQLDALARQHQQELAAAERRHQVARAAAEDAYQAEAKKAATEFANATIQVQRRHQLGVEAAEKKYQDESWVITSVLDDESENNPKFKLEKLKAQLVQSRDWLKQQLAEMEELFGKSTELMRRRHIRMGEAGQSDFNAGSFGEAFQAFPALAKEVQKSAERIRKLLIPRLFYGWNGLLLFVVIAGGLFGLGNSFLKPEQFGFTAAMKTEWMGAIAGVAVVLPALVLTILYQLGSWRSSGPATDLLDAIADVRKCHAVWLAHAKRDVQAAEKEYKTKYAPMMAKREQSLKQLEVNREAEAKAVQAAFEKEQADIAKQRDLSNQRAAEEMQYAQKQAAAKLEEEKQELTRKYEERRTSMEQGDSNKRSELAANRENFKNRLATGWIDTISKFGGFAQETQADPTGQPTPWSEILSSDWTPPEKRPDGLRLGEYKLELSKIPNAIPKDEKLAPPQTEYLLPAMVPFPTGSTLILSAEGTGCQIGTDLLKVAMLRYLTQFPPGQVRFTVLDPSGLGETFAPFMQLTDFDELLMTHRIWTDGSHIEQQLANLTEHMENVFQKYLRDEFTTIEEFNEKAGEVAEPYRVLVVANYPSGFSERATQRLKSIIQSGPTCGVHTIISVDRKAQMPAGGLDLSRLGLELVQLDWEKTAFMTRACGPLPLPLVPDELPDLKTMSEVICKSGEMAKNVRRVEVPYQRIAPKAEQYWTFDSRRSLEVPLGRSGATNLQFMRLGKGTSQHVLMAGKTGSGKSTLLHIIITTLSLRYSPDEVEFYLIDFKKGVEFKTYAASHLPHARVIAIESDREFGVSVLERLDAILKERGELFRDAGVQDIGSFRDARPDVRMPRILFLVDEFQEFFVEDDRYSQSASLLLDRLVRQGRAFGMHVILGSQTLGGSYSLPRTTIGQMAVRIALQCSENDAHLILSEDNTAARLLTRPGEAIYNDANGMIEGNNIFQVAWLGDAERDTYLEKIEEYTKQLKTTRPEPIIFEGNIPADPAQNKSLRAFVRKGAETPSESVPAADPAKYWIGEAVSITGPTLLEFRRWSGSNLLIVGQDQRGAHGIMQNTFVALTAGAGRPNGDPVRFHLFVDPTTHSGSSWSSLIETQPWRVDVSGPDEVATRLTELRDEVKRRETDQTPLPPIFLIIDDLSRFRSLRKSGDEFSFGDFGKEKSTSPDKDLADILRDGPPVGVHTIIWCDTSNNIDRWFNRSTMREFDMRIVFQMSSNDSSQLIDSPEAGRIGPNRAILYSDERGTREKFRPYGTVSDSWREWIAEQWNTTGVQSGS